MQSKAKHLYDVVCQRCDAALLKLQFTLEQLSVQIATSNKIQIVILRAGHST